MSEVIVTRGGQITLTKDVREKLGIREGETVIVNTMGHLAILTKRNPKAFDNRNFLPPNFTKVLKEMRSGSTEQRLKRLGILG